MDWTFSSRYRIVSASLLVVAVSLCLAVPGTAVATTGLPNNQDDLLEDLGQYSPQWFAEMQDVELDGDLAYVFGVGGLAIFDVSNPTVPVHLGRFEPVGHPYNRFYRGAVSGNVAVGGGRGDLLTIMDVSDPTFPMAVAFHGKPGHSYEGAAIQGSYVYACRHSNGLEILDISTPAQPVAGSTVLSLVNAWDVALNGTTAYVADGIGGLAVIDISNPLAPVHVTSIPLSGSAVDVAVDGTVAVVCVGSAGLEILDITAPLAPVLVGNINTSGLAITAAVVGDRVHVADWDDVETFDLSNPALPVFVGGEDTPIRAMGLAARSDLVVVADWSQLRLYNPGPSTRGDIHITVDTIDLGFVPVGATVDTFFTIGNTGNGPVQVTEVVEFGDNFEILTPTPLTIPTGGTVEIGVRLNHVVAGYEATFIRVTSDDSDEGSINFSISADDHTLFLGLGQEAPDWALWDREFVLHRLSDLKGRVVVMAFFANW